MIRTYVIPETNQLSLSINIPDGYVGEKLAVLVKKPEEIVREEAPSQKGDVSRFLGTLKLTEEESASPDEHIKTIRDEWEAEY